MAETDFPAFIRAEYDEGGAFNRFEADAQRSATRAEQVFQDAFAQIRRASEEGTRNAGGAFNLDFNAAGAREAAEAAELQAVKLRAAEQALSSIAREEGEVSEKTRIMAAAWRSAATEAENFAQEQNELATTLERVEKRSAGTIATTLRQQTALDQQQQHATRRQRNANIQLGQQFNDVVVQAQAGTSALTIFAQQGSQVAFAMTGMAGKLGTVGTFLSGPFGAAIFGASVVLGGMITALFDTADAAETAKTATDALGGAQSALANIFSTTNIRIEEQIALLRIQASLMAVQLRTEAAAERLSSGRAIRTGGGISTSGTIGRIFSRGQLPWSERLASRDNFVSPILQRLDRINQDDDPAAYRRAAERAAREIAELPATAFGGLNYGQESLIGEIMNSISAPLKERLADEIDRSLATGRNTLANPERVRPTRTPRSDSGAAASRLAEFGADAADKIERMRDQFTDIPQVISRANQAMRQLDDLAEDIQERRPPDYQRLLDQITELRPIINDSMNRPVREFIDGQEHTLRLGRELLANGEDAAELLQTRIQLEERIGRDLKPHELTAIEANIAAERRQNVLIERRQEIIQGYVSELEGVQSLIEEAFGASNPLSGISGFFSGLQEQFSAASGRELFESLLGPTFRDLEERLRQRSPLEIANDNAAVSMDKTRSNIDALGDAAANAANALESGVGASDSLADSPRKLADGLSKLSSVVKQAADGSDPIVVQGRRIGGEGSLASGPNGALSQRELYNTIGRAIGDEIGGLAGEIGGRLGDALQGSAFGQAAGGLVLGRGGSSTGASIGGAVGNIFATEVLGPLLGKTLGQFAGPLGSIAGGIIGGAVGKLLSKTPSASATIGFSSPGNLSVTGLSGTKSLQGQVSGAAGKVIDQLQEIVAQLGGELSGPIGVSIGIRNGNIHVDPTGSGKTKKKQGAIDFGEDEAAAIEFAVRDAISDGVIQGLRAATQRLIQGEGSLEQQLKKALAFEGVFDELDRRLDPLGHGLRELNKEFADLQKIFAEASASTEEYAQLEQLYFLRREELIKEYTERQTSTLRDFLKELTVDNDARPLRRRLEEALAEVNPFLQDQAKIQADPEGFTEAASRALDLRRQISGSQEEYFVFLDLITAATKTALAGQEAAINAAIGADNPFSGGAANDNSPVVSAIDQLGNLLHGDLQALNQNFGNLLAGGGGGFVDRALDTISTSSSF